MSAELQPARHTAYIISVMLEGAMTASQAVCHMVHLQTYLLTTLT